MEKTVFIALLLFLSPILLSYSCQMLKATNTTGYEILIITPEEFYDEALRLKEFKDRTGRPTAIASLERSVYPSFSYGDGPEKIKRYIALVESIYHIKYVILIGDADKLPVRFRVTDRTESSKLPTDGEVVDAIGAYYASDIYYADLYKEDGSFEDWDYNRNGYYAEFHAEYYTNDPINVDRIDMVPDIAVGRIPASTVGELRTYIDKVIRYESGQIFTSGTLTLIPMLKEALIIAPIFGTESEGYEYLWGSTRVGDYVADTLESYGFTCTKLYDDPSTSTSLTSPRAIERGLERVPYMFAIHLGHANRNVLDLGRGGLWYHSNFINLRTENKLPIFFSVGCGSAGFVTEPPYQDYIDESGVLRRGMHHWGLYIPPRPSPIQSGSVEKDSLAEAALVKTGGGTIVYIGAITGAQSPSMELLKHFFEGYHDGVAVGDMWKYMITQYVENYKIHDRNIGRGEHEIHSSDWFDGAQYDQPLKFLLFGDPSLVVGGLSNHPPILAPLVGEWVIVNESTRYTLNPSSLVRYIDVESSTPLYRWDLDGDGDWDIDWTTTNPAIQLDDGVYHIRVQASDGEYYSNIVTLNFTVRNISPEIKVYINGRFVAEGSTMNVKAETPVYFRVEATDPGPDTLSYRWDLGEGATPSESTSTRFTAVFESPVKTITDAILGTSEDRNITVSVRDDDGGVATRVITLSVVSESLWERTGRAGFDVAAVVAGATFVATTVGYFIVGRVARRRRKPY